MYDFDELGKINKSLFERYLSNSKFNFKIISETDDVFNIEIMGKPLVLYKLVDGRVNTNSLLIIREYAEVIFNNDLTKIRHQLKMLIHDKLCIGEFKMLPLSKEIYVAIYSLDLNEKQIPTLAIKLLDSSTNLNNYFDITPTFYRDNAKVGNFIHKIDELIDIDFDEIVTNFSSLEFLYETRYFENRNFELDLYLAQGFPLNFYKKDEIFKRTKLSFQTLHLFRTTKAADGVEFKEKPVEELTFKDVYCLDDILEQFRELGELITNYYKYEKKGIRLPYGVLLVGEPGTGKTLLTNAFINEYKLNRFDYVQSTYKENKYGGSLEDIFYRARKNKPAVIIIDEIDKIDINSVLFQEMNGQIDNNGILVIATANSTQRLHEALLRPGRFDRKIRFRSLSKDTIQEMLQIKLDNKKIIYDLDFETVVNLMPYASGAHIDTYINEALIRMTLKNIEVLTEDILFDAIEFVDLGYVTPMKYTDDTKEQIRIHEAGHAIIAAVLNGPESVVQINTIPSSMGSGYVKLDSNDGTFADNTYLLNKIKIGLGGIVAEKLFTKSVSIGASNDLLNVRRTCERMIVDFGLINISAITTGMFDSEMQRGTETAKDEVINESKRLIEESETEVKKILLDNEDLLWKLVKILRDKPKLLKRDFIKLFV